jgi:hypothetical protein
VESLHKHAEGKHFEHQDEIKAEVHHWVQTESLFVISSLYDITGKIASTALEIARRNKKIYPLPPLFHISHIYGKVTDECNAPKMIPIEHMYLK